MFCYSAVMGTKCMKVAPGGVLPIPLSHVMSYLWVRPVCQSNPVGYGYVFCNKPITWSHVSRPGETSAGLRMCISNKDQCFRWVLYLMFSIISVSSGNSIVSIATDCGLDCPRFEPCGGVRFSVPGRTSHEAHPLSCTMGTNSFPISQA